VSSRILTAVCAALLLGGCSRPATIAVGSKDTTEQRILGEILAQHLERRTGAPVVRRLGLGDTRVLHQALLSGEIGLYPEYSGLILSELLKETPASDATVVLERARIEMRRIAQLEVLAPLGFDARTALVVRASAYPGIHTATQAAASATRWKVGLTSEFQAQTTGLPALNSYRFDMGAPLRTLRLEELFPALQAGEITLAVTTLSDGHLTRPEWKALADDRSAFPPAQAVILARSDLLATAPNLQAALQELSGKIDLETMRTLNAQVAIDERPVAEVAAEFLKSAGLQ
jgi:glycine betaine/choline ABC-type transport system substrate-binding protein